MDVCHRCLVWFTWSSSTQSIERFVSIRLDQRLAPGPGGSRGGSEPASSQDTPPPPGDTGTRGSPTVVDGSKDKGDDVEPALLSQEFGHHEQVGTAEMRGRGPAQGSDPCAEQRAEPTVPPRNPRGSRKPPSSPVSPQVSFTLCVSGRSRGMMRRWQSPETPDNAR